MPVLCRKIAARSRSHVDCLKLHPGTVVSQYSNTSICPSPPGRVGKVREVGVPGCLGESRYRACASCSKNDVSKRPDLVPHGVKGIVVRKRHHSAAPEDSDQQDLVRSGALCILNPQSEPGTKGPGRLRCAMFARVTATHRHIFNLVLDEQHTSMFMRLYEMSPPMTREHRFGGRLRPVVISGCGLHARAGV